MCHGSSDPLVRPVFIFGVQVNVLGADERLTCKVTGTLNVRDSPELATWAVPASHRTLAVGQVTGASNELRVLAIGTGVIA